MPPFMNIEPNPQASIQERFSLIKERIRRSAETSGRTAEAVCLVAVTKTVSAPVIAEAVSFGITNLGENKVQEAMGKRAELDGLISSSDSGGSRAVRHHLLGPLQTNKARKAVELFNLIQTVDRPKVASFLDRVAGELGKRQRCLIEVKISPEPTKSGISMSEGGDGTCRVVNRTGWKLHDAGLLRKTADGELQMAWLGTLPPSQSAQGLGTSVPSESPVEWTTLVKAEAAKPLWPHERDDSPISATQPPPGTLSLRELLDLSA